MFDYTNKHFYPHIIRSFYADSNCKEFLNKHEISTKEEVENKLLEVAKGLGHKKFNKKNNIWEVTYKVTVENYIRNKYYEEMKKLYQ